MKKLLILSAAVMAFGATPVLAEDGGEHRGAHKGKMFQKHDTNGDGTVSKEEFLSHAEERFSSVDADGSGDISEEEAKAAHEAKREKMKERMKERKERREERKAAEAE